MLLAPEDFARAWGADALVQPPAASIPESIPSDTHTFLIQAGLPALIQCFRESAESKITFSRLVSGLSPLLSEPTVGPELPPEWSVYWILGDEFFSNGAAWWCVHEQTGQVDRIDIELEEPIDFVNTSVAHFASAVLATFEWSNQLDSSAEEWPSAVDRLEQKLMEIDPVSMEGDQKFWPGYLGFLLNEGSNSDAIEKGSRYEGEQAFKAGPW